MPKKSLYNHFQRFNDDYYIAYNARSGAVALMTPENFDLYSRMMEKLSQHPAAEFSDEESELLKQLEYGKFVCRPDFDEQRALQFEHHLGKYGQSMVGLVIAPTMNCNMACEYCYEENKSGRMSEEMCDAVMGFTKGFLGSLRQLDVTWYGGEPLLAMDIIEDLTQRFFDLAREHRIGYASSIVTNGYLMTPEVTDRLEKLWVRSGQITLDGPARLHNKKRPLKNGKDSFDTIIENLVYATPKIQISIRVNIDQSFSADTIRELLAELKQAGLNDKVSMSFGHLEPSTQVCANIAESCYDTLAFSKTEAEFYRVLLSEGFRVDRIPAPATVACMAQIVNSFVVDPGGYLYRCWNYVGDISKSMGNIKDPLDFQNPNFVRLFDVDPFKEKACRDCNLLPLCMGGCPARRADRKLKGEEVCESWKHNLEPMLEIIAAYKQLEAQQKASVQE